MFVCHMVCYPCATWCVIHGVLCRAPGGCVGAEGAAPGCVGAGCLWGPSQCGVPPLSPHSLHVRHHWLTDSVFSEDIHRCNFTARLLRIHTILLSLY